VTTLIVGSGYLGRRVAGLLIGRGDRVLGTTRSAPRAAELQALGIEPILADVLDPGSIRLPAVDRILYCVGFDRSAGVSMRDVYVGGLRDFLAGLPGRPARFVYASSTGVYGQDDGGWVDEDSPTEPRHESGRVCLEGETVARGDAGAVVLRFAGLYGPGRIVRRASLERGEPVVGDPAKFLNLVHIDDAAAAAVAALDRGEPARTYLIADNRPVPRSEYYGLVAGLLGRPAPQFIAPAPGGPDPRREEANKRVSNRRMRTELAVVPRFPDIATGLPAALAAEAG